ncbi:hypothetical protein JYT16_01735 [Gemmatimonas aurantiaca]|nr:hypothetical protein [Gemmatimonas aurantiaca]
MIRTKLIIGLALCGLTVAYFMHRYPVTLPYSADPELPAEFILRNNNASAVMIVDTAIIRSAWKKQKFSEADFSYAWLSILEKQIGYFDILNIDQVTEKRFQSVSLIVSAESVLRSPRWQQYLEILHKLPATVIMIFDTNVVSASRYDLDAVNWFVTETLAKTITEIRQGSPAENFSVVNRYAEQGSSQNLESNDLVSLLGNIDSSVPQADSLALSLFNTIAGRLPFPRWHTAPDTFSGIFLMTHDDEGIGDAGVWMNEYESAHDYTSTTFLMPSHSLSASGIENISKLGGEAALHWNRFERSDKGTYDTLSFLLDRWRPFKRKQNLKMQLDWLKSRGVKTTYNRNHYFLWDNSYARTFRILKAHGITMDFSYGPDLHQKGFLFGSAFPFHPLDENGASFMLYETPVTWVENFAGADSAWITQILTDNARQFHGVIAPLYHNNTYQWGPDYEAYNSWRRNYEIAQTTGHTFMRVSELERFLQNRRESALTWTLNAGQLIIHCKSQSRDLALLVPAANLGRPQLFSDAGNALPVEQYRIDQIQLITASYWRIVTSAPSMQIICNRLESNIEQR